MCCSERAAEYPFYRLRSSCCNHRLSGHVRMGRTRQQSNSIPHLPAGAGVPVPDNTAHQQPHRHGHQYRILLLPEDVVARLECLIPRCLQHGYWVVSDCPCHYQITAHSRLLHLQGDFPVPLCFCSRHPLPDIQKGVPRQGCVSGLCTDCDLANLPIGDDWAAASNAG